MNNEARKIAQAIKEFKVELDNMVTIMGTDATTHFKENFVKQGFDDDGVEKWKPRKRLDRRRPGRAILTDKGVLKRSIRYKRRDRLTVEMHSNRDAAPYAVRHNEGIRMVKRQFVGKRQVR
jgi:hypothetical protein